MVVPVVENLTRRVGRFMHDDDLRVELQSLLKGGLETKIEPRAWDQAKVDFILSRLREIDAGDYENKLVEAGFTLYPWGEGDDAQSCETCMYYVVHRRFCELPELMMPVEADWSCTLWRI